MTRKSMGLKKSCPPLYLNVFWHFYSNCMKISSMRNEKSHIKKRFQSVLCRVAVAGALALPCLPLAAAKDISAALEMARQLNEAFIAVADTVSPAVVVVEVAHKPEFMELDGDNPLLDMLPELRKQLEEQFERRKRSERANPSEPRFDGPGAGRGSGIVIREDGYILTNTHVVEGAEKIRVRFKDGQEFSAEVRGTDPQSDIAVIKINASNLPVAKLADSSKTRVGEFAIAIGAPFDLDYSVTFGHVSAKGRTHVIPSMGENSLGASMDQDFIQTDASINPGNSGGPLVNIYGEVIGINTLIRGLRTGIGFAIPSNMAKQVSEQLITEGRFTRAWLGLSVEPFKNSELRSLVEGVTNGVVVKRIERDGPAMNSELRPSDIITAVEGEPVSNAIELRAAVRSKKVGTNLTLDVYRLEDFRKGKNIKVKVKSAEWLQQNVQVAGKPRKSQDSSSEGLGLTVQALTKELAEKFGAEVRDGVIVTGVKPGSPAAQKGIKVGDIITEVGRKPITTLKEFRDAMKNASSDGVVINLISDGVPRFEILKDSGD
jgi:serine protease Do